MAIDSLVCPVVMSADTARKMVNKINELEDKTVGETLENLMGVKGASKDLSSITVVLTL